MAALAQGKGYGTATINREVDSICEQLKVQPALAIDIGGNVGDYTAELRRRNPTLEIHTFEPNSANVEKLRDRFADDENITIVPLALSDSLGRATLFSNQTGSGLASLTQRRLEHFNIEFDVTEVVETIRFEDYWATNLQRRQIDIVKMDIEGHEFRALMGFGAAIFAVGVLQFEFGGANIDTRTFFQDFWYFFKQHNFEIMRITPSGAERITEYRESHEYFSTTNFIAVRS